MVPKPQASTAASVKAEAVAPLKILNTTLPRELLRGVTLWACLAGFGTHWKNSVADDLPDFSFSQEVESLDDFLSHDWATSRWPKLCALLVVYNSRAAAIATILTTLFWSILAKWLLIPDIRREHLLFEHFLFTGPVIVVFHVVLIFWQRIKRIFAKPRMVFLDKLCISQHDMKKKGAGIAGLAAFLSKSRRMVILWYFSRLWCTYEIGAFLRLHKQKDVEIIPASFAAHLCIASVILSGSQFVMTGLDAAQFAYDDVFAPELTYLIWDVVSFLAVFAGIWSYLKVLHSLAELSEQLSSFSIRAARCFCCDVDHCIPETGEDIPCDRRLIYGTLGMWYSGNAQTDPLDNFDREVRSQMTEFAAERFGSGYFPATYFIYMLVVCHACVAFSYWGKAVVAPLTAWLEAEPEAANPIFRISLMLDSSIFMLFVFVVMIGLVRLTDQISCLKRYLLLRVTLILLLTEGLNRLQMFLLNVLKEISIEAAFASELVQALFCMAAICVMASRPETKSFQRPSTVEDL
eukprot:Skav206747  [mRNA]  locus=scaffold1022:129334:132106:+ [translate_table: standard]